MASAFTAWFEEVTIKDVGRVGGKNASLGEMIRALTEAGIRVPPGFAVTAEAYRALLDEGRLDLPLRDRLAEYRAGRSLAETGRSIRQLMRAAKLPAAVEVAILGAYRELGRREESPDLAVAVRSSATAEDLPEASFAGQQETFLNVRGEADLIEACRSCFASLFTDRAIAYRDEHHIDHLGVALSIGVQRMVRSDRGASGVMFTLDTETGFPDVVLVNASYGLGENIVQGTVNPDEYLVFKPLLGDPALAPILRKKLGAKEQTMVLASGTRATRNVETPRALRERYALEDAEVLALARWAKLIEDHYSHSARRPVPMDIEWAKDGLTGKLYVVQARPETVQSRARAGGIVQYRLESEATPVLRGRSVGSAIASGPVCIVKSAADLGRVPVGAILVAELTDPDWVPAMRRAAGVVTDHGGRTCHAAIVSRELGLPAVVGTGVATRTLQDGEVVTIPCAQGEQGVVYRGALPFRRDELELGDLPRTRTRILVNLADPAAALRWWRLPVDGIGLARMEFIITNDVGVHPMALAHPERVTDPEARRRIEALTAALGPERFFVETLGRGIAMLAATYYPRPVIVRMSDFKTNEYAELLGGAGFEPREDNPMIGFRGASRYYHPMYRDGFALECRALKWVRETLGLTNVVLMIPFCRTLEEADRVLEVMGDQGLRRGERGLQVYVMCEIPSNVILAREFAQRFDGFSIGSNDLTQLTLGVDRDSELLAPLFDERNPAVVQLIRDVIGRAHESGRPVGICGQAPSDHAEFADLLVDAGIDSISLDPDSVIAVRRRVAAREAGQQ